MGFSLKNILSQPSAKGQVIDGHLILSLPHAAEPVVWRMELDKIGTASFEVKQDNETGAAKLVLKPKKGTAEVIAPFSNKEDAVEALLVASNALQNAKPQSVSYTAPTKNESTNSKAEKTITRYHDIPQQPAGNQNSEASKWLVAIFGAIIVIGLYYYLTTLIPENITGLETQSTAISTSSADPASSTGVPVSADEFLGSF